ncbi:MAG TPA: hypothetical protein VMV48_00375 [Gallionellaceae bacterium]|nr:hypothetical protein [Gallionellaceae bacterium]
MSKNHSTPKILDTEEAWLSSELGADEQYAAVAPDDMESIINENLDLQPISIRLEKSLIEDFKLIADLHGLGYQPLMRQTLKRFADCEKKRILREVAADMAARKKADKLVQENDPAPVEKQKKAA